MMIAPKVIALKMVIITKVVVLKSMRFQKGQVKYRYDKRRLRNEQAFGIAQVPSVPHNGSTLCSRH